MNKKNIYPFLISFIFLIVVIIINRISFTKMRDYASSVDHARMVISSLEQLSNHLKSAQIYTPSNENIAERNYYILYKQEASNISRELESIRTLVKNNPDQAKRMDSITRTVNAQMPTLMQKNIQEILASGESWRLNELFNVHLTINRAINQEKQRLASIKKELDASTELTGLLTIVFSVLGVLVILITFISNLILRKRRRWLENFLSSVLNTSQNGIITLKAVRKKGQITDFRILFANKAVESLLGLKPEKLLKKRIKEFPSLMRDPALMERFIQVTEHGEQQGFESLYEKDGNEKWFYILIARLEDGLTASFHDITELKHNHEELKENIKKLEHSNTELEQYAYVASHDLQEPLRKIRTYASYLSETEGGRFDERGKAYMEKIISAAERMSALINDILSFSSLKREPAFMKVDLGHVLKNMLIDLDLLIAQKRADITYDKLPVVEAIPLQMHQLFYNLINNALKFSKENQPAVIRITSRHLSQEEVKKHPQLLPELSFCEITLSDNGIGFNPEFSEQIFGLFKRLGTRKTFSGSGIGLALCRKVVNNHNGVIYAEGRLQQGATFHIILPIHQPTHHQIANKLKTTES
jgi:PAS domain S-box-containing protein